MLIKIMVALIVLAEVILCWPVGLVDSVADIWIPFALLPLLIVGVVVLYFLFLSVIAVFINKKKFCEKPVPLCKYMIDITAEAFVQLLNVEVEFNGMEKIPTDRRFLLVSNHRSAGDPFVLVPQLRKYGVAFISKPENFKIPWAGEFAHKSCYLPIDRENARNAMKTLRVATDYIKNDIVSIVIYPEGTRTRTGELLEFKDGIFYVAKRAECPIVVLTCQNTEKVFKNLFKRRLKVRMDVLDVIEPEEFKDKTTHDISDEVRNKMLEHLGK